MPLRRILVAVDGSEGSVAATDLAVELAKPGRAELTVLQVVEEEGPLPTYSDRPPPNVDRAAFLADRSFGPVLEALQDCEILWNRRIEEGSAPEAICRVAEEENADLIVIGSRGLSVAGRLLLGSVSDKVARHAPCSVLVAR